jgi:thymidylate synthase (FAD)
VNDLIKCLDHGHVQLQAVMGDDHTIVEAARNSISGERVKAISEDRALIRYLMRHKHTGPFEFVIARFHVKLPIFVARQFIRHRTFSFNEMSGRYGVLPEEFYVPEPEHVQFQAERNKQGRSTKEVDEPVAHNIRDQMRQDAEHEFAVYKRLLGENEQHNGGLLGSEEYAHLKEHGGLARELARINLPLSTYTQWVCAVDLHNLFHFLQLRMDPHAQYEIRVFADAMAKLIQPHVPLAYEAFEDFRLNAVTFSAQEVALLGRLLATSRSSWENIELHDGAVNFKTKRERDEWLLKIEKLAGK